ncbi:MAG TPA: hypothetical protein VFV10_01595 [Gammaproteobacteria bacterium]|nr:hypothetical protein [Gammaproteobacteria bacterium]
MSAERLGTRRIAAAGLLALAAALLAACGGPGGAGGRASDSAPDASARGAGGASAARAESRAPAIALDVPAGPGSGEPRLSVAPGGEVLLTWLEPDGDDYAFKFARLEDGGWSAPGLVARRDDFVVNWADLPSVQPLSSELWAAHWLASSPEGDEAYDISVSVSRDGGKTWSEAVQLNSDRTPTEHGFVTLFPWQDRIGAVWLDGRNLESGSDDAADGSPAGTTLRYGTIDFEGDVEDRGEIDSLVCDCCRTGVALTTSGPLVIYRDRTPDEIRDIAVRRSAGPDGWAAPTVLGPDDWRIDGCPVNGPAVAARDNAVAAAWFTAASNEPRVRFARSSDGGSSFGPAVDVDGAGAFGQVGVVLLDDGASVVSWWRKGEEGTVALAARRIEANGTLGALRIVAENDAPRPLDVPQMALSGNRLIFVWTDAAESAVKSVAVPVW